MGGGVAGVGGDWMRRPGEKKGGRQDCIGKHGGGGGRKGRAVVGVVYIEI